MSKSRGGVLALLACASLLGVTTSCSRNYSNTRDAQAIYEGFTFMPNPLFYQFVTGYQREVIAPVYVELNDGSRHLLSELPEEVAASILPKFIPVTPTASYPGVYDVYNDDHSLLKYRDGKLVLAALHAHSGLFAVSPHEDGPYLKLPIERKRLLEVFGEPKEWGRPPKLPTGA